jgi:hypothetical protein
MIDVRHQMMGKAHLRLRFWWVKKKKIKTNPIFNLILIRLQYIRLKRGCSVRSHMVVGFTTTCAISVYHHLSCEFKSRYLERCTWDKFMWQRLSVTCEKSAVFSGHSGFLHQKNWLQRYNWNIVESGIKHLNTNSYPFKK